MWLRSANVVFVVAVPRFTDCTPISLYDQTSFVIIFFVAVSIQEVQGSLHSMNDDDCYMGCAEILEYDTGNLPLISSRRKSFITRTAV